MTRRKPAGTKKEHKDIIRWRGHEVTRIEAFSDAVFAFAVTLLVVSLEVPKNFEELLHNMYGFFPFAVCFVLLFQIWMAQNTFFRRFGLHDETTIILSATLLFMVLFFVYPLKFLWGSFLNGAYGNIPEDKIAYLYYIYGGGFAIIYFLFVLMYYHAIRNKDVLQLTDSELFETKTYIYRYIAMTSIGILSIMIAFATTLYALAGMIYILIGPALGVLLSIRGKAHRKKFGQATVLETVLDDEPEI